MRREQKIIIISTEFCREVTDIQMPHVAPVILPEMYKIFIHAEVCWKSNISLMFINHFFYLFMS